MNYETGTLRRLGIGAVLLHAVIVIPHSIAHSLLHIQMVAWQRIFILVVIVIAPIVSAVLLWREIKSGFILLAFSMGGAFLFGLYYHFMAAGPDNVASLNAHSVMLSLTFQLSAVLLALIELAASVVGLSGVKGR